MNICELKHACIEQIIQFKIDFQRKHPMLEYHNPCFLSVSFVGSELVEKHFVTFLMHKSTLVGTEF